MHGNGFSDVRRRDSLADVLAGRTEGNCASEILSGQREGPQDPEDRIQRETASRFACPQGQPRKHDGDLGSS